MNATPHAREMRRFFYEDACAGVLAGAAAGLTRMSVRLTVPETDVTTDVYRVGTLLELVRELAASLAQDGRRVKVCVQQSLGQGVFQGLPLSLSGVSRIAASMDWGQAAEFVSFGQYGRDQVEGDDSDFYVCIAPQNVEGDSIQPFLQEMVEAAEAKGKAMVLVNPRLADIPSANGVMGVRGRGDRMAFTASFEPAYHFRLLYVSGQLWPIRGALRYCYGGDAARWEVYKRIDLGRRLGELEEYRLLGVYEREPDGKIITAAFTAANRNANG